MSFNIRDSFDHSTIAWTLARDWCCRIEKWDPMVSEDEFGPEWRNFEKLFNYFQENTTIGHLTLANEGALQPDKISSITATAEYTNHFMRPVNHTLTVSEVVESSVTTQITVGEKISISEKVSADFLFAEAEVDFSVEVNFEKTAVDTTTVSKEFSYTTEVELQPGDEALLTQDIKKTSFKPIKAKLRGIAMKKAGTPEFEGFSTPDWWANKPRDVWGCLTEEERSFEWTVQIASNIATSVHVDVSTLKKLK